MKLIFTFLLLFFNKNATCNPLDSIAFIGVKERTYCSSTCKKNNYIIYAKKHVINKKIKLSLNLRNMAEKNNYYENGEFVSKKLKVKFKKAYKYSSNFYMYNCSGVFNGSAFHAKNGVKYDDFVEFDRIILKDENITKIRNSYRINF